MPQSLEICIRAYMDGIFGLQPTDRIFPYDKSYMGRQMKYGCEKAGIQKIRVHGVRHPYVKPKTKKFITFFEVFGQLHSCP